MLEKLDNVVLSNDDIHLDDVDSDIVTFFSGYIIHNVFYLTNINLDDDIFEEDGPISIVLFKLQLGVIDLNNVEHGTLWWDWCVSEDA